jgi:hypothetical protein
VTSIGNTVDLAKVDLSRFHFADFTGNGLTDIYYITGYGEGKVTQDIIWLNQGEATFKSVPGLMSGVTGDPALAMVDLTRFNFVDLNGNGMTDIYYITGYGEGKMTQDIIWLSQGDGDFKSAPGLMSGVTGDPGYAMVDLARFKFVDVTGNGLADIYYVTGYGDKTYDVVWINHGNGNFATLYNGLLTSVDTITSGHAKLDLMRFKFINLNGNKVTDLYYINGWGNTVADTIHLNRGYSVN